jgi:peptidoglycan/xylan/chitin deacetylase (PgdA/CDA1 family)
MRVPVLCYHRIEQPPAGASGDTNFVTPELFARHLAMLARSGYTGITVRDLLRWQREDHPLPRRPIALTFDDGYASVVEHAVPQLAQYGWPCTLFAVSAYLGGRNVWDPHAPPATLLDAVALRQLLADGHDVGAHTRHHRRVRGLDAAAAAEELAGARQDLEQLLGTTCHSVAFPYGSHDPIALQRVREAGYTGALTLKRWANGRRTNPLRLGRLSVGGPLPPWQLLAKLAKMGLTPAFA